MSPRRSLPISLLVVLATQPLSACAALGHEDPQVCDGRHRRPANPYGSILAPWTPSAATPAPAAPAPDAPAPDAPAISPAAEPLAGGCA